MNAVERQLRKAGRLGLVKTRIRHERSAENHTENESPDHSRILVRGFALWHEGLRDLIEQRGLPVRQQPCHGTTGGLGQTVNRENREEYLRRHFTPAYHK